MPKDPPHMGVSWSGGTNYYHADGLGSITTVTDAAGSVVNSCEYDSFGKLTGVNEAVSNRFRYTAREDDGDTKLYYYRARYYDTQIGRFLSEDPIGFEGGLNLYSYVRNRPANFVDPLGLFTVRDGIRRHRTLSIDSCCDRQTGGACTRIKAALVLCTCECGESGWKAKAELRIYGDMYVYSGPWHTLKRRPKDRGVVDEASAIAHEYNVHIDPATAAVTPAIEELEAKTFNTKGECTSACDATSETVNKLFPAALRRTQEQESRQ